MEALAEIISDFFNSIDQKRKGSERANVVRFTLKADIARLRRG